MRKVTRGCEACQQKVRARFRALVDAFVCEDCWPVVEPVVLEAIREHRLAQLDISAILRSTAPSLVGEDI